MLNSDSQQLLRQMIADRMMTDTAILDQLRSEIQPLKSQVRRILPRSSTAISLVGTDGGNNRIQFDPFLVQLVRIVDSSNNEYCLEAITPTTSVVELSARQFDGTGNPQSALGELMDYLQVRELPQLSHMIRHNNSGQPASPSWVQVYRELVEWAILFRIVRKKDFGTDTLILFDGLLRSTVFAQDFFQRYLQGLQEGVDRHARLARRRIYLAGMAKHSKVLARYRMAMALENIMTAEYPSYLEIPREIEDKTYVWSEYARGDDRPGERFGRSLLAGGKMFFIKFGSRSHDPIWTVDIFLPQVADAPTIFGSLLADALNGFPIPLYPLCLQRAHENAALIDFDVDILQDFVIEGLRKSLNADAPMLDTLSLQNIDPARNRY
jgi:hypothetical protein